MNFDKLMVKCKNDDESLFKGCFLLLGQGLSQQGVLHAARSSNQEGVSIPADEGQ